MALVRLDKRLRYGLIFEADIYQLSIKFRPLENDKFKRIFNKR